MKLILIPLLQPFPMMFVASIPVSKECGWINALEVNGAQLPYQKCQAPQPYTTLTRSKPSHPRPSNGASPLTEMNKTGTIPRREADPSLHALPTRSPPGGDSSLLNCTALCRFLSAAKAHQELWGRMESPKYKGAAHPPVSTWSLKHQESSVCSNH